MGLPEEEKAILTDSILNIQGGLNTLYQRIKDTENKITELYVLVEKQQRLPGPTTLQEQLNDIKYALKLIEDDRKHLDGYIQKARDVVDAIHKGVFD